MAMIEKIMAPEMIKEREDFFLSYFPELKDLKQNKGRLVVVHRRDSADYPSGEDMPGLEESREPSTFSIGLTQAYFGIIKPPYFRFEKDSIYNLEPNFSGKIFVRSKRLFRGENPNAPIRNMFEAERKTIQNKKNKDYNNIEIFVRDATKKPYAIDHPDSGTTTFRQVEEFELGIGDEQVYKFLATHYKKQYKDIEGYLKRNCK